MRIRLGSEKPSVVSRRGALGLAGAAVAGLAVEGNRGAMVLAQESTPAATSNGGVPPDFKAVLHTAEPDRWPETLSNLRNLNQEWPQARLRLVVDGSAVLALQGENHVTDELAKVAAAGVRVQVCPRALRDQGIDPATIPAYAQTTLDGVIALVLAQHEGFAYVKP